MEPITNITKYEARISYINNVMASLLYRIEDLSQGSLGQVVSESGIKWGAALIHYLALHLEKVKKDGEDQCSLLRGLCTEYNQKLEELKVEQDVAKEEGTAARLSRIELETERRAIHTEQGVIVSSLKKIEHVVENERETVRTEQGNIISSLKKIEENVEARVVTKVADIVRRFEELKVQTVTKEELNLEIVIEDKRSLQNSLAKPGSVVESKDIVIVGLQDEVRSLNADLIAMDLELVQERDNRTQLRRDLDIATSFAQTQRQELATQITVRDELNNLIARRDDELKSFREEAEKALVIVKRDHREAISLMEAKMAGDIATAQMRVEQLSQERDGMARNLERVIVSEGKTSREKEETTAKLELAAKKETQFANEIAKLSKKLATASQKEEQLAKDNAFFSIKLKNALAKETELGRELVLVSKEAAAAQSREKILLHKHEQNSQQIQVADGAMKTLIVLLRNYFAGGKMLLSMKLAASECSCSISL